jgi:predicted RNA-binding protein Jag
MKKFIFIILIFFSFIKVNAYENNYFKIEIPDDYILSNEGNNLYEWDKDNSYIAVSITDNTKTKYNIKNFTSNDINVQKNKIEETLNSMLEDYDVKATVTSIKKDRSGIVYFLEYDLYLPSSELIGYDMYQKGRVYSTKKYLITFFLNSDGKINDDEFTIVANSFKVNDSELEPSNTNYLIAILVIGGIAFIVLVLISLNKKKQ